MAFLDDHTDEALVTLVKQDNEKAFEVLYNRYWKRMLVKAFSLLDSASDAEEVVQNTFISFWQRRHRLELKYTFHTYIASAVKYEVFALIAKNKKRHVVRSEQVGPMQIADDSTRQWLDFEDLHAEIETAVLALPEKCRLVFRLSREEKLSEKQIADTLYISPKTVQAHLTKALKTLRISLRYYVVFFSLLNS